MSNVLGLLVRTDMLYMAAVILILAALLAWESRKS